VIGTLVSSYRIESKIGQGGMGDVYLGVHDLMGKRVAIKVLRAEHSENNDVIERFFREARAIALLSHPGAVDVYDTGRLDDGRAYIVMAYLEGLDLKQRLVHGAMEPELQVSIAKQIAETLSAAHDKGIIHRDLKPDNVFLLAGDRVKILDFGVAKLVDQSVNVKTKTVAILGSPPYMSPEQCRGAGFVDHRSDIYALGCLMFEMAARRAPFVCKGFGDYLIAHCVDPAPLPSTLVPIDPAYERIIMKALSKKPEDRQANMAEVMAELDAVKFVPLSSITTTLRSERPPIAPRPPAPAATNYKMVALVLGIMAVAAAVATVLLLR
jgi:eukaryotic-like serine/threonine-protein kinase